MRALLVRVDERLLHGQVTLGWAGSLHPRFVLLANDVVAEDPVQRRMMQSLDVEDASVRIQTIQAAGRTLRQHPEDAQQTLVVVSSLPDAVALRQAGAPLQHVNLGGLYEAPGRRRWLDYVWLSDPDIEALQQLIRAGVDVEARDLPAAPVREVTETLLQTLRHAD